MSPQWRETFQFWAQTDEYGQRIAEAQAIITRLLSDSECAYVAFSGGKDSTVMLHLVLAQAPATMVLHWDYGPHYIPRPVHQEIIDIAQACGARNLRIETSASYQRLGRRAINVLGRELIAGLLPRLAKEGYDLAFVGLRKEESVKRRHRINAGRSLGVIRECWPVQDLIWMDVWAYLVANNVPYLSLYDSRAELVGYENARFTTLFDPEFYDRGGEIDNVIHWRWRNSG